MDEPSNQLDEAEISSNSKRIRSCGHLIHFYTDKHGNKKSDIFSIVLTTPAYFIKILLFLNYFDNVPLRLLTKYHNKFYKNENNKKYLKTLLVYKK